MVAAPKLDNTNAITTMLRRRA